MKESKPDSPVVGLIAELRTDPQRGWQEFVHAYSPAIMRVVSYCERDRENQAEAFVYVCEQLRRRDCRRLRKFDPDGPASFTTWLHAVVRNLCRDWRRKVFGRHSLAEVAAVASVRAPEHSDNEATLEELRDGRPDPLAQALQAEENASLHKALATLPPEQRLALLLRVEEKLTLQEISTLLNMKNAQAADRLLREAIQHLRSTMGVTFPLRGKNKAASV